jgi:undecaprenyl-diphosphatase
MDIRIPGVSFEVAVHVATLVSVLTVFRKRVSSLVVGLVRGSRDAWKYAGLLVVATIPAVIIGLGLRSVLEGLFEAPAVAGISLLVTGAFLWSSRPALAREPKDAPGMGAAVVMGLAQAFAIIPGISRSGATVVAGLWMGVEAEEAATFSFLMAIPAILGAAVLQLSDVEGGLGSAPLLLGSLAAAIAGILAIRVFLVMLERKSFYRFGIYCWAAGGAFLLYLLLGA